MSHSQRVGIALHDALEGEQLDILLIQTFGAFDVGYIEEDRTALEAITACCVCGHAIEPSNEREYEACESLGVHLGACWQALKGEIACAPVPRRLVTP